MSDVEHAQAIVIRHAEPDEAETLTALANRSKAFWGYSAAQLAQWRDTLMVAPASIAAWPTFVADVDGVVAGTYQLNGLEAALVLEFLWVDPAYIGRGIGGALLSHALQRATAMRARTLAVDADPHAAAFYLHQGAAYVGAVPAPIEGEPTRERPQLVFAIRTPALNSAGTIKKTERAMRERNTSRLTLEPQIAAHADEMFLVLSDPAIYEYENAPPESVDWLRARFSRLEARASADGSESWLNWVVRLRSGGAAGYVQATICGERAAIAYIFASPYWGQGLASEAVDAMIDELREQYDVKILSATLKRNNERSTRLLARLGFSMASEAMHREREIDADEILMVRDVVQI